MNFKNFLVIILAIYVTACSEENNNNSFNKLIVNCADYKYYLTNFVKLKEVAKEPLSLKIGSPEYRLYYQNCEYQYNDDPILFVEKWENKK